MLKNSARSTGNGFGASTENGDRSFKRTAPGFQSEVQYHPDLILQKTMEEFRAATIAKALASGATQEQIDRLEFYPDLILDPTGTEVLESPLEDLGFKYTRFGRQAIAPRFFCIYRDPFDGGVFQIRTSWQRWDAKKGKYSKPYLFQSGSSPLYTVYPEDSPVENVHVITEGKNKADFAAAHGYICTSITGAFGGFRAKDSEGRPVDRYLDPRLKERLESVGCETIILAMDQDDKSETKKKVNSAIGITARLLEAEGYKVRIAEWDASLGKGLDDAGMAVPEDQRKEWLKFVIGESLTYEQWQKRDRKLDLMRKVLWLNSNSVEPERITRDRFIPELPELEPGAIHLVQSSGTGDGKTTAIGGWVRKVKESGGFTLVLYHANSVGKQAAEAWDLPHRHDYEDNQNHLFLADAAARGGCVMCVDSAHRLSSEILDRVNNVVFDECNQGIAHLCEGGTLKERQSDIMTIVADISRDVLARRGSVVMSEVTVYSRTIEYIKAISGCDRVRLFSHERSSFEAWDVEVVTGATSGCFADAIAAIEAGKKLIFAVASQEQGEKLDRLVRRLLPSKSVIRIDSKTNDGGKLDVFWSDPNKWLRDNGIPDLLIYSPSGRSGVSITEPGFDEAWGHFTAHHPDMWMQMVGRYRLPVLRKIFIASYVQAYSGDEALCSVRGVKGRLESSQDGFARIHGVDIAAQLVEAKEAGEDVDYLLLIQQATIDFLAAERTAIGAQKAIAKEVFLHLMETQGHKVSESKNSKNKAIGDELKIIQEELWREKAEIGAALQERDEKKSIPTWHKELLSFKLRAREEFPGISFDDAEDFYQAIAKDHGKARRGVLLQSSAENHGAIQASEREQVEAILTRQIKLPHKLPRGAMRAKLIELCGVLDLLDGESYHNEDPRAIAIKATALHWKREIRYWLNLNVNDSQTPVEICNKLLLKLGLDAESVARPGNKGGNRQRVYSVPGLIDPFRNRLLDAARQRLWGDDPPHYDVDSVNDGLAMLREAIALCDAAALAGVWAIVQCFKDADKNIVWLRLSEVERSIILDVD